MMEILTKTHHPNTRPASVIRSSNDNRRKALSFGRSVVPEHAVARFFKPSRSAMTSEKAPTRGWRLVFKRRSAPFIEPWLSYTRSTATLPQAEMDFPTLRSAIRYVGPQGVRCVVQRLASKTAALCRSNQPSHTLSDVTDVTLEWLDPSALEERYGQAVKWNTAPGLATSSSPMHVAADATLPFEAQQLVLMNWSWTKILIDQATNEGMPVNKRPSCPPQVDQALIEREVGTSTPDRRGA